MWRNLCHLREKNEDAHGGKVMFPDAPFFAVKDILFNIPVYEDYIDNLFVTLR